MGLLKYQYAIAYHNLVDLVTDQNLVTNASQYQLQQLASVVEMLLSGVCTQLDALFKAMPVLCSALLAPMLEVSAASPVC